jgi:hypothetical protein
MNPELVETEWPRVGRILVAELATNGIKTARAGTLDQRILVPRIDWKRRRGGGNEWDSAASS